MKFTSLSAARLALVAAFVIAMPAFVSAQAPTTPATAQPSLVGTWSGTVTIPLPDSSLVVPASYTFTQGTDGVIAGTAFVPGQGTGTITNVVRDGTGIKFRVTMAMAQTPNEPRALEHEGKVTAEGIEGAVKLGTQQVATFKISMKK